jgi:hypothetical protein
MKTQEMHINLVNNYISILNEAVVLINGSLSLVTEAPSIDIKKYYLTEVNILSLGKVGEDILYLSKVHDMKKNLNNINKIANDLLKDIIKYCTRYDLDETLFFGTMKSVIDISQINMVAISYSISNQPNYPKEKKSLAALILEAEGLMDTYYKVLTRIKQNLSLDDYSFPIVNKNNLYHNLKIISKNMNIVKITKINDFIRSHRKIKP